VLCGGHLAAATRKKFDEAANLVFADEEKEKSKED